MSTNLDQNKPDQIDLDADSINLKEINEYKQFMAEKQKRYLAYNAQEYLEVNWDKYSFNLQGPNIRYHTSEHAVWSGQNPAFPFAYWTAEFQGRVPREQAEEIDRGLQLARTSGLGFLVSHPGYQGLQGDAKNDVVITRPSLYRILRWRSPNSFYIITNKEYPGKISENKFLKPGDFLNVMGELKQVVSSISRGLLNQRSAGINVVLVNFVPGVRVSDPRILRFSEAMELKDFLENQEISESVLKDFKTSNPELYAHVNDHNVCILEDADMNLLSNLYYGLFNRVRSRFDGNRRKKKHIFSVPFVPDFSKTNQVWYDSRDCGHIHLNLQEMI